MTVKLLKVDKILPPDEIKRLSHFLSADRRDRVEKCRTDLLKRITVLTELLIRSQFDINCEIIYNNYGKPYIKNSPQYFSVSHTDKYIAFVKSDFEIGIDIEKKGNPRVKVAKRFFTENEQNYLNNADDYDTAFFEIWTRKEAYIKMLGTGLATPLKSFDVFENDNIKTLYYNDCVISTCTPLAEKIEIDTVDIDDVKKLFNN